MELHPETESGLLDQEDNPDLEKAAAERRRSALFDQDFQEVLDDQD